MNFPPKGNDLRQLDQHLKMFQVRCMEMPNMKVRVREGSYWGNGTKLFEFAGGISKDLIAPSAGCKVSVIGVNSSGAIVILDGETVSRDPKPPVIPKNVLPCAMVLLQAGATAITQEMIFDVRPVYYTNHPVAHNDLTYRDAEDAHSIDSITGLNDALAQRPDLEQVHTMLHDKADLNGTDSFKFKLNKNGSGVVTQDAEFVFERGNEPNSILRLSKEGDVLFSNDNGTSFISLTQRSEEQGYSKSEIDEMMLEKEDVFEKNTAFNKNFGTTAGTVAEGNHTHSSSIPSPRGRIYVDGSAAESGNGSVISPFKTIKEACEIATPGCVIYVSNGEYDEGDLVIPAGVSLIGDSLRNVWIYGNVTFDELRTGTTEIGISIYNLTFGIKTEETKVIVKNSCEIRGCTSNIPVEFNNDPERPAMNITCVNSNFTVDDSVSPALYVKRAHVFNFNMGTISNDSYRAALKIGTISQGGQSIVTQAVIVNRAESENTEGALTLDGGVAKLNTCVIQCVNTGTNEAIAIDGTRSSAGTTVTAIDANLLSNVLINGQVDFEDKTVVINGVKMATSYRDFTGSAIIHTDDARIGNN